MGPRTSGSEINWCHTHNTSERLRQRNHCCPLPVPPPVFFGSASQRPLRSATQPAAAVATRRHSSGITHPSHTCPWRLLDDEARRGTAAGRSGREGTERTAQRAAGDAPFTVVD